MIARKHAFFYFSYDLNRHHLYFNYESWSKFAR